MFTQRRRSLRGKVVKKSTPTFNALIYRHSPLFDYLDTKTLCVLAKVSRRHRVAVAESIQTKLKACLRKLGTHITEFENYIVRRYGPSVSKSNRTDYSQLLTFLKGGNEITVGFGQKKQVELIVVNEAGEITDIKPPLIFKQLPACEVIDQVLLKEYINISIVLFNNALFYSLFPLLTDVNLAELCGVANSCNNYIVRDFVIKKFVEYEAQKHMPNGLLGYGGSFGILLCNFSQIGANNVREVPLPRRCP